MTDVPVSVAEDDSELAEEKIHKVGSPTHDKQKRLVLKSSGPVHIEEATFGDIDLKENARRIVLTADAHGLIVLSVEYILVQIEELDVVIGKAEHKLVLEKRVKKMGPDMQISWYRAYQVEQVGDSLPDALRRMADKIEAEAPKENLVPVSGALSD